MKKCKQWLIVIVAGLAGACTESAKAPLTTNTAITGLNPQTAKRDTAPKDLVLTITDLDSALFDSYNRCDLKKVGSFFSTNVEFYHDESGLSVGEENLTEAVRKNICGKVRRELVAGTLNVYLMRGYGALEVGVHRFYSLERSDEPVEEAQFMHLWENGDGKWKIARAISYDHHLLPK